MAAWAFLRSNRAPEAETLLRRGIEAMPNAAGLHLNLGYALAAAGKPVDALLEYLYEIENGSADSPYTKEAAALFRDGISKSKAAPDFSEAIATLHSVLTDLKKDPAATLADLIRLEALGYRHPTLDLFRAGTVYANGDARAAERILRTLIGTDPGFLPPYFDLSQILADSNRQEEGRRFVAEAVRRNPAHWMLTGRFPLPELNPN